jgi:predicted nucleic acid-binding protein
MIGDTDFFVDLMRRGRPYYERAVAKATELEERQVRLALTTPTRFELFVGVHRSIDSEAERARVGRLLRAYPTYSLDGRAADRAGAIAGTLRAQGRPLGAVDTLIAGIALENREELLTRNARDFARVEGLTTHAY